MKPDISKAEMEKKKRRIERILIVATALLVVGLAFMEGNIASTANKMPFIGNVLVFIVINLNILLLLVLVFLVFRNFFKLFMDRKRAVPGAGIRFKLVLTFVVFSVIPMVLFFYVSYRVTTSSINFWIGRQIGDGFRSAIHIGRTYYEDKKDQLGEILRDLSEKERKLGSLEIDESYTRMLDGLAVFDGTRLKVIAGELPAGVEQLLETLKEKKTKEIYHRAKRFIFGAVKGADGVYLIGSVSIPAEIAQGLDAVGNAYNSYSQLRILNDPIKASNLGILILVALLIVFTNTWIGFYLAKDFTVPLKDLAEGAEKLKDSYEPVRVEYEGRDEIGLLVDSFNRMAEEIVVSRKELEKLNRELERSLFEIATKAELIEAIISHISTGVVTIDKAGYVEIINDVAKKILGFENRDVKGLHYRVLFPPEMYEELRSRIASMEKGEVRTVETTIELMTRKGEQRLLIKGRPILMNQQYRGLVITIDDVTEFMKHERARTVSVMARKVAHEIKNPLTPIKLSAQRLMRKFDGQINQEKEVFEECLSTILSSVERIGQLLEEFFRTSGLPETRLTRRNFVSFVRELVDNYKGLHGDVKFNFEADDGLPEFFFDPSKMRSAFINLLNNSIWAVRKKGGDGRITVRLKRDGDRVRVEVEDNGIGIPEGDHEKIFEFEYSTRKGGLGLGLSIVRTVVSDHGGKVYASKDFKDGALFIMEIPLREEL